MVPPFLLSESALFYYEFKRVFRIILVFFRVVFAVRLFLCGGGIISGEGKCGLISKRRFSRFSLLFCPSVIGTESGVLGLLGRIRLFIPLDSFCDLTRVKRGEL